MSESTQYICYLSGDVITNDNKTEEHIIPNALNGHLTSTRVLTSASNLILGKSIDSKFDAIFDIFTSQLRFRRDRGRNPNFTVTDTSTGEEYVLSGAKISPIKPFYDEASSNIYAKDKKKYNQIYKKITTGDINNVGFIDDKTGLYRYNFNITNKEFKQGVAKIAAGFATMNGIERKDLNMILDLENKAFLDKPSVIPFIALSDIDKEIESKISSSNLFPFHSLILHGSKDSGLLYCYVELFSTFQYIVILSYDYTGDDIYNDYFFSLNLDEAFDFSNYSKEIKNQISSFGNSRYRNVDFNMIKKIVCIARYKYEIFKDYGHMKFYALMNYANHKVHEDKL